MISQDQPGQIPPDDHDSVEETQRLSGSRRKLRSSQAQRKSRWIGIGLLIAILGGVIAGIVSIATVGNDQTASGGSSAADANSTATGSGGTGSASQSGTSKAKGKVISAAKLAQNGGALGVPTSKQGSVTSWQAGPGGRNLTAVSSQLGTAMQAAGVRQYVQARYACIKLADNVAAAEAAPSIPNAPMQKLYTKALAEVAKGAADCQAAISVKPSGDETTETNVNTAMLHQSISELSAGATNIFRATAEIEIISRQHH